MPFFNLPVANVVATPEDVEPFREFFRAPLLFGAEQNALVFSADWMSHPLPNTDAELHSLIQKQIDALFSIHSRTLSRRLKDFGTTFQELLSKG